MIDGLDICILAAEGLRRTTSHGETTSLLCCDEDLAVVRLTIQSLRDRSFLYE